MLRTLRQRLVSLRVLWIALLLLCVAVKPVIVLACEVHEAHHALQTGHGHDDVEHLRLQPVDEPTPSGGSNPWHAVLHQGHCCVHGAALVASGEVSVAPVAAFAPGSVVAYAFRSRDREPMLRPPIRI